MSTRTPLPTVNERDTENVSNLGDCPGPGLRAPSPGARPQPSPRLAAGGSPGRGALGPVDGPGPREAASAARFPSARAGEVHPRLRRGLAS